MITVRQNNPKVRPPCARRPRNTTPLLHHVAYEASDSARAGSVDPAAPPSALLLFLGFERPCSSLATLLRPPGG
ncbi:hypothetical protein NDU88_001781 [Pleurodeles waltl]|uniref:Uncharacterized protein n=1 Tax=Pleurodeles waltl TaxID=8319 RepID=A0AAV7T0B6_PLEWA|nr:hypothetical protein NDU88_001781 [Pleurodeles waltl]